MNDKLLDQADALMRRRSFVAGSKAEASETPEPATSATSTDADAAADSASLENFEDLEDIDVPVLTEVVEAAELSAVAPPAEPIAAPPEASLDTLLQERLAEQRQRLDQAIETWLDERLPQLVISAMDGITDYLVSELREHARAELLPHLATTPPASDVAAAESADEMSSGPH